MITSLSDSAAIEEIILEIYHFYQVYGIIVVLIHTLNEKKL